MRRVTDIAARFVTAVARGSVGRTVLALGDRPSQAVLLYDAEGSPYCRPVREALTMLDLDAEVRPCPIGGARYQALLRAESGDEAVPYLVDPNTGTRHAEASQILHHLFRHYGQAEAPHSLLGAASRLTSPLASRARAGHGTNARPSRVPAQPLHLWSFEACPHCRLVRETLTELELPYRLHSMGKGSPKRPAFLERTGKLQFPYLEDPNTGVRMFESVDICAYLERTWGGVG